jgi:hypothetical protein
MLDLQHFPGNLNNQRQQAFLGTSSSAEWVPWVKPKGISWVSVFLVGRGGDGGNGVIGANSTAAGGGGGASGSQTHVLLPAWSLPDTLFLNLPASGTGNAFVCLYPDSSSIYYVIANATKGGNGGNGAGATAGAAGTAGTVASNGTMNAGWCVAAGTPNVTAGRAGGAGGTTGNATSVGFSVTSLRVMGGGGGGGLPAAGASGTTGAGIISNAALYPQMNVAAGQATATLPPNVPDNGFILNPTIHGVLGWQNYGGVGSGSTHGTATGGGLVQVRGGNGAPGCGGGGSGGALTGSTAATGGNGGPAFCILTTW